MVRRKLSLPFTDVIEDDKVVADEEINKRKWKSYHEVDVKQNMGYGRYIHKIIQNNYNAKIIWIADKFPDEILDKTQLQRFLGSLNYISDFYQNLRQQCKHVTYPPFGIRAKFGPVEL